MQRTGMEKNKIFFVANTGFALYNFRLSFMKYLVGKKWDVVAIACDEADYASKFGSEGIRFINVSMDHKGKNPIHDMRFLCALTCIYRSNAPLIVHHFTIKPVIFGSLAAKFARVPHIVNTITGLGYVFETGGWLEYLTRKLYVAALSGRPRIIFQNSHNRALFLDRKIATKNQSSVILGSGVDTATLLPRRQQTIDGPIIFLLVSRMIWSKGVREYVTAAQKVNQTHPDVQFIMAGGVSGGGAQGNPQAIPEKWLIDVNQARIVKWVGRLPFTKVMELMDQAHVVVLPSYYPEGTPRSLLEAASNGKAIITTDAPGCRDVVEHGVNGFLVPPKDAGSLADRMMEFVSHPELVSTMGLAGRRKAIELFDEKIVFKKTLRVYKKAGLRNNAT